MVVDRGLEIVVDRILGAGAEPHHIAWGIGTTPPVQGNTGLETASAEARTAGTGSKVNTTTTGDTYQVAGAITCTSAGKAITEVGLFDDATTGNLFVRATFSAINVSVNDSINFTIKTVLAKA